MQDSVLHGSHNIPMLRCRDIQRPSKACCEPVLASRCLSNPATLQITALPRLRHRLTMRSSPSEYPDFASAPHPSPDIPASSAERYCSSGLLQNTSSCHKPASGESVKRPAASAQMTYKALKAAPLHNLPQQKYPARAWEAAEQCSVAFSTE